MYKKVTKQEFDVLYFGFEVSKRETLSQGSSDLASCASWKTLRNKQMTTNRFDIDFFLNCRIGKKKERNAGTFVQSPKRTELVPNLSQSTSFTSAVALFQCSCPSSCGILGKYRCKRSTRSLVPPPPFPYFPLFNEVPLSAAQNSLPRPHLASQMGCHCSKTCNTYR